MFSFSAVSFVVKGLFVLEFFRRRLWLVKSSSVKFVSVIISKHLKQTHNMTLCEFPQRPFHSGSNKIKSDDIVSSDSPISEKKIKNK